MFKIKFLDSEERIKSLEHETTNRPELKNDVALAKKWIQVAREANDSWLGKLTFGRFDTIFSAFDQLRHLYCRILPWQDLMIVTSGIRYNISQIDMAPGKRQKYEQYLEKVEKDCKESIACSRHDLEIIRHELEIISRSVSSGTQLYWRKVNLLRTRLSWTAGILSLLLIVSIILVPSMLSSNENVRITHQLMIGLVMFGALGGLFSALRLTEPLKGDEASYYIKRLLLWLRPIIGASAGIIICLLNHSGLVSLAIISQTSNLEAAYLVLAFLAGFSERFFVSQLEKLMNPKDSKDKGKVSDPQ